MTIGKNFLTALERRKRLLERLHTLEEEIQKEQERLRVREQEWALQALVGVLAETDAWTQIEERWREVAGEHFELWAALGLHFLLPGEEGKEARRELVVRDNKQEEQEQDKPRPAQEQEDIEILGTGDILT